jgi:hypothetical protein
MAVRWARAQRHGGVGGLGCGGAGTEREEQSTKEGGGVHGGARGGGMRCKAWAAARQRGWRRCGRGVAAVVQEMFDLRFGSGRHSRACGIG